MNIGDVKLLLKEHVEDKLDAALREDALKRAARPYKIGAWNVGSCPRKNWLLLNGEPPEPLAPRSLLTFEAGHATEDWVVNWLIKAGVPLIRPNESRDTFDLPPIGRMRPDVFIDAGGLHIVADVKSMSNRSFERAQRGDIGFEYKAQLACYMKGLGLPFGCLIAVRKETSHIDFTANVIAMTDDLWSSVLLYHSAATGEAKPDRPHALESECAGVKSGDCFAGRTPTGKQAHKRCGGTGLEPGGPFIPNFPCGYCPVKGACWGKLEPVYLKDGEAPRFRAIQPID